MQEVSNSQSRLSSSGRLLGECFHFRLASENSKVWVVSVSLSPSISLGIRPPSATCFGGWPTDWPLTMIIVIIGRELRAGSRSKLSENPKNTQIENENEAKTKVKMKMKMFIGETGEKQSRRSPKIVSRDH